ncbi:MAG TPA: Rid family detoxifying hydrolase [Rhodanobacter sp.]|jgi:reactive intermediate/imine deaminase|nr:Rid family detoxifying hydrolase [Rhodanobacter sp.]
MKIGSLLLSTLLGCGLAGAAWAQSPPKVEFLNSGKVVGQGLPFSEAVRVGNTLYLSGEVGIVPGTMQLVPGGIKPQARQAMDNIKTVLETQGLGMRDLVKCTVMLADMSKWDEFNEVYKTYFHGRYPARSAMGVNGLAIGAQVEIECVAVFGGAAH